MPDFGAPVAKAADPSAPFEMLNQVLGLKQRQQQLQSGALTIQGQQQGLTGQAAQVQQEQQTAAQRSGLAKFFQDYDISSHMGADGTLDMEDVFQNQKLRNAAGDQYPQVIDSLIGFKQKQLQAKGELAKLDSFLLDKFNSTIGAFRESPEVRADTPRGRAMVTNGIAQFGAAYGPEAARIASIYGGVAAHAPPGKLWAGVNAIQLQGMDAATQAGKQAPTYVMAGDKLQQTNPQAAGGGFSPAEGAGEPTPSAPPAPARKPSGAPAAPPTGRTGQPAGKFNIPVGLSPTEQPDYKARVANVDPDVQRYNQISGEAQSARQIISLSEQVAALSDQVRTGKFSKAVTDAAAIAKQNDPGITASQMLHKYTAQLNILAQRDAGTDAQRDDVKQAMPNPDTMGAEALKYAAQHIAGIGELRLARSQAATDYVRRNGGTNGMRAADDAFTNQNDSFGFEFRRIPSANIAEQQRFLLNRYGNGRVLTDVEGATRFVQHQGSLGNAGK